MYALLSVSDKTNIVSFAKELIALKYIIISTGGTYDILKKNSLQVKRVSDITKFHECFDGRVKTLHPMIHGAILNIRDNLSHKKQKKELGIKDIDLVCVNLYPFEQCVKNTSDENEIIENIDIGGPTLIRGAAKNFKDVLIATNYNDYKTIIKAIKNKKDDYSFRKKLMIKAYEHTGAYDSFIANYFNKIENKNGKMADKIFIVGNKVFDTRYGENPHQKGALYEYDGSNLFKDSFNIIKGEPSFNNLNDISCALNIVASFRCDENYQKAICIVKHGNPCGFSIGDKNEDICDIYDKALICDSLSAYGGVVCVSDIVNEKLALKMNKIFFEVIYAPFFTKKAIEIFSNKKRIKLFSMYNDTQIKKIQSNKKAIKIKKEKEKFSYKQINNALLCQQSDFIYDDEVLKAKQKTIKQANKKQFFDMLIAYKIAALSKSNCIVFVKNKILIAIGMGMTSRVDASLSAIKKAKDNNIDLANCVMASEAFFPFKDSIELAAKIKVSCIIQPGGSMRDDEVIKCANENNIALYFSDKRHFLH